MDLSICYSGQDKPAAGRYCHVLLRPIDRMAKTLQRPLRLRHGAQARAKVLPSLVRATASFHRNVEPVRRLPQAKRV